MRLIQRLVLLMAAVLVAGCAGTSARSPRPEPAPSSITPLTPITPLAPTTPSTPITPSPTPPQAILAIGHNAWISVAVARLWDSPAAPWRVDAPALAQPVRFRAWLAAMTLAQRRALDVRSQSEALLGARVVVTALRPGWAKVVVASEPTPLDRRGYPGWIPTRQLTARAPAQYRRVATVMVPTTWLSTDSLAPHRTMEISLGTQLPVLAVLGATVRVVLPTGAIQRVASSAVVLHASGTAAAANTAAGVVRTARSLLGVSYLWGGLSGFGVDCSGLVWLAFGVHGVVTPRDADPQYRAGRRVLSLRIGDLLFYASGAVVHHVSFYLGGGLMLHAPGTGSPVQIARVSQQPLRSEYVGARRFTP